jgi:hypothetical protein
VAFLNPTVLFGDIFVSILGQAFSKDQIQQRLDEPLSGFLIEMRTRVKQPRELRIPSIKTVYRIGQVRLLGRPKGNSRCISSRLWSFLKSISSLKSENQQENYGFS